MEEEYKIGDTVFIAVPPHYLKDTTYGNVLEGEISKVIMTKTSKVTETEYMIDFGLSKVTKKAEDLYTDVDDAIEKANNLCLERVAEMQLGIFIAEGCYDANQKFHNE